jgi:GNAT superfamily N-acetyltransferase
MERDSRDMAVEVVGYEDRYRAAFERLNREWIEAHFHVEPEDEAVFADPYGRIVAPRGEIFFLLEDGEPVGTCALLPHGPRAFELGKMAVTARAQGRGCGERLLRAAIGWARERGAEEVLLSSNSRLEPALRLYRRLGFEVVPLVPDERYQRVDVMMRLRL